MFYKPAPLLFLIVPFPTLDVTVGLHKASKSLPNGGSPLPSCPLKGSPKSNPRQSDGIGLAFDKINPLFKVGDRGRGVRGPS